tara:strand:+ start:4143 stop:5348 length:1206 start_codon:yes stop_codon:yes gene_type:complete
MNFSSARTRLLIHTEQQIHYLARFQDQKLDELIVHQQDQPYYKNQIYLGKITRILPHINTAFVDIGLAKQAYLPLDDIGTSVHSMQKQIIANHDQSSAPQIYVGQMLIVQVKKPPYKNKGAKVSSSISLATQDLVLSSQSPGTCLVSNKIKSSATRTQLQALVHPFIQSNLGWVIRTHATKASEQALLNQVHTLKSLWQKIQQAAQTHTIQCLHSGASLMMQWLEDNQAYLNAPLLISDTKVQHKLQQEYATQTLSDLTFAHPDDALIHALHEGISQAQARDIPLPCKGSIIIEPTEALTVIDVNSDRYLGQISPEHSVEEVNLEAAIEVARQLRLRQLSGLVIIDFINMTSKAAQKNVYLTLQKALKQDTCVNYIGRFSYLGLLELSRQKRYPSINENLR